MFLDKVPDGQFAFLLAAAVADVGVVFEGAGLVLRDGQPSGGGDWAGGELGR